MQDDNKKLIVLSKASPFYVSKNKKSVNIGSNPGKNKFVSFKQR